MRGWALGAASCLGGLKPCCLARLPGLGLPACMHVQHSSEGSSFWLSDSASAAQQAAHAAAPSLQNKHGRRAVCCVCDAQPML